MLIALVAAIEGLMPIVCPAPPIAIVRPILAKPRPWAIAPIVAGAIPLPAGFTGRADALP